MITHTDIEKTQSHIQILRTHNHNTYIENSRVHMANQYQDALLIRVSHKTERFLMFFVSQLSWLGFVSWFQRHKILYWATTSSIPSFCLKKSEKYKGFSKSIKGKNFQMLSPDKVIYVFAESNGSIA